MSKSGPRPPEQEAEVTSSLTMVRLAPKPPDGEVTRPYFLDWKKLEEPTLQLGMRAVSPADLAQRPRKRVKPPLPPASRRRKPPKPPPPPPPPRIAEPTLILRRRTAAPASVPPEPSRATPEIGLIAGLVVALAMTGTILALLVRQLAAHGPGVATATTAVAATLTPTQPTPPPAVFTRIRSTTASATAAAAEAAETATLSFKSDPPATVVLDGKKIGETPQLDVRVAAGEHVVQYYHRRLGRRDQTIDVEPGDRRTVVGRF